MLSEASWSAGVDTTPLRVRRTTVTLASPFSAETRINKSIVTRAAEPDGVENATMRIVPFSIVTSVSLPKH